MEQQVVKMLYGSHLYGTAIETSDTDYKVIFLPAAESILLEDSRQQWQSKDEVLNTETEAFSLKRYLKLLIESQTVALDMLFAPETMYVGDSPHSIWQYIRANKSSLLNKKVSAFVGYCRAQSVKHCVTAERLNAITDVLDVLNKERYIGAYLEACMQELIPLAIDHDGIVSIFGNYLSVCGRKMQWTQPIKAAIEVYERVYKTYGERVKWSVDHSLVDWKALYHAVRIANEAEELLLTHNITFPRPEKELLLDIRLGKRTFDDVMEMIDGGLKKVEAALLITTLPENADMDFVNCLVHDMNANSVMKYMQKEYK